MSKRASKKASASRRAEVAAEEAEAEQAEGLPPGSLSAQYEEALLGAPEVTTKTTRTTSRPVLAPSRLPSSVRGPSVVVAGSPGKPVTRLATPKKATPVAEEVGAPAEELAEAAPKTLTTSCTTEVTTPKTGGGVEQRLKGLGYSLDLGFVSDGTLQAVLATSPLGEKVLIATPTRPRQKVGGKYFEVEGADDPVADASVYEYFLGALITKQPLGRRVDTNFAILTPDGLSVWANDGTVADHWLYLGQDVDAIAELTGLRDGWFVLASVELDALKEPDSDRTKTIVDRLYEPPVGVSDDEPIASFAILIQLLRMAGLLEVLRTNGPYTLLAPNDDAFARLPENVAQDLVKYENRSRLAALLEYHIYAGKLDVRALLKQGEPIPTLEGEAVVWDEDDDGDVSANDAEALFVDLDAKNGIVHVLDGVLLPKNPAKATLAALLEPVDFSDIDYTTWKIRGARAAFDELQGESRTTALLEAKTRLDGALASVSASLLRTRDMTMRTLRKTQAYNDVASDKSRAGEAVHLLEDVSVENAAIDDVLMQEQGEVQDLLAELEVITAQAKAIALRLAMARPRRQGPPMEAE
jgi:uncharacterized surface protein with fasciclin (FAS1) repeats